MQEHSDASKIGPVQEHSGASKIGLVQKHSDASKIGLVQEHSGARKIGLVQGVLVQTRSGAREELWWCRDLQTGFPRAPCPALTSPPPSSCTTNPVAKMTNTNTSTNTSSKTSTNTQKYKHMPLTACSCSTKFVAKIKG